MVGPHAVDRASAPQAFRSPRSSSSRERPFRTLCVLIPAWQPTAVLVDLVDDLLLRGFGWIMVVNDGSTAAAGPVFAALERLPQVEVLHDTTNRGKGSALKTGFAHLLHAHRQLTGVVTADADGQHRPADIERVAQALLRSGGLPVLGARGFEQGVPWRSRLGNRLTRHVFRLLTGTRLRDTQTGLRGLPRDLLPELLALEGDRYEYEMTALAHLCRSGHTPSEVSIETVYIEGNRGSHFHPVRDSFRIYAVLLRFGAPWLFTSSFFLPLRLPLRRVLTELLPWIRGL